MTKSGELKTFGLLIGGVLLLVTIIFLIKGKGLNLWLALTGGITISFSFLAPAVLAPFHLLWVRIGTVLGKINTSIILSLFFFFIITPLGLIRRMFKLNPRQFVFDTYGNSSWIKRPRGVRADDMKRPF